MIHDPPRPKRMLSLRLTVLAGSVTIASLSGAVAQIVGFPPQPHQQRQICSSFVPMREEVEKILASLKSANERKAPREEFCQLFSRLSATTAKISKFLEQNKSLCNIPDQAIQSSRNDHSKSLLFRKQACSAAPPAAAQAPSLSDVLGAPIVTESSSNKPDMGTFNTLTGNPLTR
jgi:hypothetical protein